MDVVLGDALLTELVGLGFGIAAGGSWIRRRLVLIQPKVFMPGLYLYVTGWRNGEASVM